MSARVTPWSRALLALAMCVAAACAPSAPPSTTSTDTTHAAAGAADANGGIDSLNARLSDAYRRRDPAAYGALYTDSAVFEWPAIAPVRGRAALEGMARDIWAPERDVELRVRVATRRVAPDHATEFGAFEQTWTDTAGVRRTEFGRYTALVVRGADARWRFERWLGFEDSVRAARTP